MSIETTTSATLEVAVVLPIAESQVFLEKIMADYVADSLGARTVFSFADGAPATIETPDDVEAAEAGVVRAVVAAAAAGARAVVVACFSDPGVRAAAQLVDVPVVGEGAPTIAAVGALYDRFSILSASSTTIPAKTAAVARLGLASRLQAVVGIDVPVAELTRARAGEVVELIAAEAEAGAQAVVLGCTGLEPGFTAEVRAAAPAGVAVVDPAEVAGRIAVALAASRERPL